MPLTWTPHPILETPSQEEQIAMGAERLLGYWQRREAAIEREREDPFNFGTELPHWAMVDEALKDHGEVLVLGGNRSGKTEYAAKRVVQSLVANPGMIIWCFTATSQNSIAHQQAAVYRYLPNEFKELGRSRTYYVSFSYKNGFTSSSFILPNKATCVFRTWQQDISTIEGGEIGCPQDAAEGSHNFGAWFDEEVPLSFLSTTRYRCLTRADSSGLPARIISTFTTVSGWTNTVSSYLSGARTIEEKKADLLDGEMVPILQQPIRKNASVVYFHTKDNPYGGYNAMVAQLAGASRDEKLCRAYGVPTKPANTVFPNLDERVIVKHDDLPVLKNAEDNPAVWVLSIDPAGNKSWFMVLIAVTANGTHYVADEWPDPRYGPWADLERGEKGRPGDAAMPNGYGIKDYADVIRKMTEDKGDVEIIIDPRMGAAQYSKSEGTSNIIADLQDEGINVYPAEALPIDDGLQAINSLLSYDKSKPIGFDNHPKLIFSDKCGNTVFCCSNYVVDHGAKGVCKDPVDALRYACIGNYRYYEDAELAATKTGGY